MNKVLKGKCGRLLVFLLFLGISFAFPVKAAIYPARYKVPKQTRQLVVVKYQKGSKGKLTFYQKNKAGNFKKSFSCSAWLGKNGIHKKREGDRRTPTGLFTLDQAFGLKKNPGTKMPYLKVTDKHYWCDDSSSSYYNTLIRSDKVRHVCHGEHLIDYPGYYDYAISIGYNKKAVPKKGSAIFLHCYKKSYTGGCVAVQKAQLKKILKSLRPEMKPMILIDRW